MAGAGTGGEAGTVIGTAAGTAAGTVVDVAIVGGGLVGASLAIALEPLGLRVVLIEGVAPQAASQPSFDDRTSALGNGTRRIFETLGVWPAMAAEAAPIRRIHVSDSGRFGFARLEAAEHGIEAFGYVLTNRVIGAALRERLQSLAGLELRMPARVTAVTAGEAALELAVEPGAPLRARLVVAADGANSVVRAAAGLESRIEDYRQVAMVAHVRASRPSDGTAYERFTPTGPIAVLPLHGGALGVVWTLSPENAARVQVLDDAAYLAELQRAVGWRAGRLLQVGLRNAYPLRLTRADTLVAPRTVLVGNAAQGLHPVAGQGFNLGLRDAVTLAEVLAERLAGPRAAGERIDCGSREVLETYASRRRADRDGVMRFTDGLVKLFRDERPGFGAARDLGLLLFDLSPTAKDALSRISWGFAGRTPRLARGLGLGA
ncbi:MAG: 2-octaprenyl-6-methoxyphenyl hydroxylase [Gammaproteobacteria bacterium]|nr:2-octaprenyl-6-methoxyphenyl hydroxylase [Gammaproteobacteria bacterium]